MVFEASTMGIRARRERGDALAGAASRPAPRTHHHARASAHSAPRGTSRPDRTRGRRASRGEPRAIVVLANGSVFAAWRIGRDAHLLTAYGRFRRRDGLRHAREYSYLGWATRSWPTHAIREIRWSTPTDAEAVA